MEECPKGYPRLAAFLDSDDGFTIFRRFGYVQARLLLEKQDDMRRLENEMLEMDKKDHGTKSQRLTTRDEEPKRDLLQRLETKYHEYGNSSPASLRLSDPLMSNTTNSSPSLYGSKSHVFESTGFVGLRKRPELRF